MAKKLKSKNFTNFFVPCSLNVGTYVKASKKILYIATLQKNHWCISHAFPIQLTKVKALWLLSFPFHRLQLWSQFSLFNRAKNSATCKMKNLNFVEQNPSRPKLFLSLVDHIERKIASRCKFYYMQNSWKATDSIWSFCALSNLAYAFSRKDNVVENFPKMSHILKVKWIGWKIAFVSPYPNAMMSK